MKIKKKFSSTLLYRQHLDKMPKKNQGVINLNSNSIILFCFVIWFWMMFGEVICHIMYYFITFDKKLLLSFLILQPTIYLMFQLFDHFTFIPECTKLFAVELSVTTSFLFCGQPAQKISCYSTFVPGRTK